MVKPINNVSHLRVRGVDPSISTAKRMSAGFNVSQTRGPSALGALVNADLGVEAAMLTSFQIKQQLASQSLNIANQRPQVIRSLFG